MKKNVFYETLNVKKIEEEINYTSIFLLPAAGLTLSRIRAVAGKGEVFTGKKILDILGWVNCYSYFPSLGLEEENVIYLLFMPSKFTVSAMFPAFLDYLRNIKSFRGFYSLGFCTFVVVLKLEERWDKLGIINLVNSGKYSKLGNSYANRYFNSGDEPHKIITKNIGRKKYLESLIGVELDDNAELASMPIREKETLLIEYKEEI